MDVVVVLVECSISKWLDDAYLQLFVTRQRTQSLDGSMRCHVQHNQKLQRWSPQKHSLRPNIHQHYLTYKQSKLRSLRVCQKSWWEDQRHSFCMPIHQVSQSNLNLSLVHIWANNVYSFFPPRNVVFDLDNFINQVCIRFENSRDYDAPMVLIEWID